jgi:heme-degrading monooxygenase HmoA
MAFVVINSVSTSAEDLPRVLAEVHALGLDVLRSLRGFRSARLITSEDQTEAALIMEWESRDDFAAYRQSPVGQKMVERGVSLHPRISFYDVVVGIDP